MKRRGPWGGTRARRKGDYYWFNERRKSTYETRGAQSADGKLPVVSGNTGFVEGMIVVEMYRVLSEQRLGTDQMDSVEN